MPTFVSYESPRPELSIFQSQQACHLLWHGVAALQHYLYSNSSRKQRNDGDTMVTRIAEA